MIQKMGFAGYFLIVSDFIRYAKSRGIPVGPGRGSGAGSLAAYCLGITEIDPLVNGLLFERFLNPERVSPPDIDIDFCIQGREEVIQYVRNKYGQDHVAQIITFGKMQARAVIRDVGRAMDMPYGEVDRIAKMIPNTLNITLEEALHQEPRLNELAKGNAEVKKLLTMAQALEGLPRHASTHAAGVVISSRPLVEVVPLYRGQGNEIVTQYAMKDVEKIGLIKFDFLGLKTLTMIEDVLKRVEASRGERVDLKRILLSDRQTYGLLCSGDTSGVFQLESSGMKDLVMRLMPERFEDLVALLALYRPGPLKSGMVDDFIKRKQGKTPIAYDVAELKDILEETYGVIVYQEQVMKIATKLASFSLAQADILRRAMGKKNAEEMAMQKKNFIEGAQENKIAMKKAEKLFDLMAKFAEYGFNKSHSAAYALLAFQTAYLKAHYPVEFMAGLLSQRNGEHGKDPALPGGVPGEEDRGPSAGREREPPGLHRGGGKNPIRPGRGQECGSGRHPVDPLRPGGEGEFHLPGRLLPQGGPAQGQQAGRRKPDQMRGFRQPGLFPVATPGRPGGGHGMGPGDRAGAGQPSNHHVRRAGGRGTEGRAPPA